MNCYEELVARGLIAQVTNEEEIKKMVNLCKEYNRPMPTEIKMIYDVNTKEFHADYKYESVYSTHKTKTAYDVVNEWMEEVKNQ